MRSVTATLTRSAGFDGAVHVALKDLPAGVSASPVIIASGTTSDDHAGRGSRGAAFATGSIER